MGIYLDNAATSYPKPNQVAKSIYEFMINNGTSSGRGSYKMAMKSDFLVYETRKLIGELFNFKNPKKCNIYIKYYRIYKLSTKRNS